MKSIKIMPSIQTEKIVDIFIFHTLKMILSSVPILKNKIIFVAAKIHYS